MRSIVGGISALVLTATLAACGGSDEPGVLADDWDGIVQAAKDEGSLTLYTSAGTVPSEELIKAFTDKYGVDVTLVRGIDSELLPKIETELNINKGIADVFITSDQLWTESHPDAVTELKGPAVDEDAYNAAVNAPEKTWAATHAFIAALSWNTDLVSKDLATFADLLDPSLSNGKIGLPDPDVSPSIVQFYQHLEAVEGVDYVEKLAAQSPRIYSSTAAMMQAIASGEVAASPYTQLMVDEKAAGAPVEYVVPEDAWGVRSYGGVMKTAPNPNAAQLFMDFVLSHDGQVAFTEPKYGTPRNDVEGAAASFDSVSLVESYPDATEVSDFRSRFKSLMK
ncbi:extracellular solute-binding protein [Nocardioides sp. AE5]|uniref:extracellular solute-binding protein n=1 Tax=Nocardioides sp. AE5 TaxID=2962573 RepID=UPI002882CEF1|nr:extracellular solute-binding protein [Nocardioides sp. AE5]MDT0202700.1 extracellular solute-binding protein [Nocardioides sp. AE5]